MRVKAVMIRILRQLGHDKRTIGLMIFAPILVLTLMSFIFNGSEYHPKIGIVNAPLGFVNKLEVSDAKITRYSESDCDQALKYHKLTAIINFKSGIPYIKLKVATQEKAML